MAPTQTDEAQFLSWFVTRMFVHSADCKLILNHNSTIHKNCLGDWISILISRGGKKGVLLLDFPASQLQLVQFGYDYIRDAMCKINGTYEFPSQPDLDRNDGAHLAPDADLNIRSFYNLHRYNSDDALVTKEGDGHVTVPLWLHVLRSGPTDLFSGLNPGERSKCQSQGSNPCPAACTTDLWSLPPERSKEDSLLFFILYNPKEAELCFARIPRMFLMKSSGKSPEIRTILSEMDRFMPYEQIELHGERVKYIFSRISYLYSQDPTLAVLHMSSQLCQCFFRRNSSSRRPYFAPMEACSRNWIMTLQSLALHLRILCSLVFKDLRKVLELHPGLLNRLQGHVHLPLMEIAVERMPELPQEILMDIFALLEIPDLLRAGSVCSSWNPGLLNYENTSLDPPLMETTIEKMPELPQEILMDIFALLEIPDLVRAGSVCSSWNNAYTKISNIGQQKQTQTPCLLYTSESAGDNVACLYSLAEKRAYNLTLPEPPIHRRYLIGSSHGCVITVDERSEMHLVNPITSEQIALPSVITIEQVAPIYDNTGAICKYDYSMDTSSVTRRPLTLALGKLRHYLHHKALVFYDASIRSYIVVFIHNPFGQLLFARLGDERWTRLPSYTHFQDCIYKDGVLYAVTSFGEIIAFDLRGPVVTTEIIMNRVKNHYGRERVYIVQAPWGDLLQVWRPEVWIKEEVDGHRHEAAFENKTKWMEIFKVCTVTKKRVQINSLDDHVLFLGSNQSLCLHAKEYPQLKPNHIYFTDDVECVAYSCERGYRLNIGVLDFESKSMEEIIFPRPWSNCLAPLFIVPNTRRMNLAVHI